MGINIGLVVHDKINLQNAVDLAAYYGAAKQARVLNAISHQNYQIRQAWKLFSWRYNALGSVTSARTLPSEASPQGIPILCALEGQVWRSQGGAFDDSDRICHLTSSNTLPPLPKRENLRRIAPDWFGTFEMAQVVLEGFHLTCANYGALNWSYGASVFLSYLWQQRQRVQLIKVLARNLMRPIEAEGGGFVDLKGESVFEGMENTFQKNLTYSNTQAFKKGEGSFKVTSSVEEAQNVEQVFSFEKSFVHMLYYDYNNTCDNSVIRSLFFDPVPKNVQKVSGYNPADIKRVLHPLVVVNVAKKPQPVIYVEVEASTKVRQLFGLGKSVHLKARARAKAFGGRVGPMLRPKPSPQAPVAYSAPPNLPPKGLGYAQRVFLRDQLLAYKARPPLLPPKAYHRDYFALIDGWGQKGRELDAMVWPRPAPQQAASRRLGHAQGTPRIMRVYELQAVRPNLWDIMHYSVFANAGLFTKSLRAPQAREALGLEAEFVVPHDVGYHPPLPEGEPWPNEEDLVWQDANFGVRDQMRVAQSFAPLPSGVRAPSSVGEVHFFVKNLSALLTGWAHPLKKSGDFSIDGGAFGRCYRTDINAPGPVPSGCIVGGRAGYSVKVIK